MYRRLLSGGLRWLGGVNPAVGKFPKPLQWRSESQCLRRSITNASKPDHISHLLKVPRVDPKPGGWKPTLIHSSGEVKFTVIRLDPGCEVPTHFHHKCWDYFVPLRGQGLIETKTKSGETIDYPMNEHSFLAMPPEDIHRVRNQSEQEEFVFLLAQAPRAQYDFVDAK